MLLRSKYFWMALLSILNKPIKLPYVWKYIIVIQNKNREMKKSQYIIWKSYGNMGLNFSGISYFFVKFVSIYYVCSIYSIQ